MHRSGTSLTAGLFQRAGLELGADLLSGKFDNPKGHYEDIDFLSFHRKELSKRGISNSGLYVSNYFKDRFLLELEAKRLIQARSELDSWGWKEPRSTLFLCSWKTLIPQLKVLAVYRHPSMVVNSLERRLLKIIFSKNTPLLTQLHWRILKPYRLIKERQAYYNAWLVYNQSILRFAECFPNDIIIVNLEDIVKHPDQLVDRVRNEFRFSFKREEQLNDFIDFKLLTRQNNHRSIPRIDYMKEWSQTYELLSNLSIELDK